MLLVSPKGAERGRRHVNRRGQSLVEFAVVALVIYMLLAAILTFGQLLYCAQTVQQAADVAAREISRTPLSATADMMDVLYSTDPTYSSVRTSLFNPALLQFDLTTVPQGETVLDVVRTWPVVNQMLFPLMIPAGSGTNLVYPGAVPCTDSRSASRSVWCVAEVTGRQGNGAETITWVPVVDEMNTGAFSVATSGLATVRVNFGYQSATIERLPAAADLAAGADRVALRRQRQQRDDDPRLLHAGGRPDPAFGHNLRRAVWPRVPTGDGADGAAVPEPDFGPGGLSARGVPITQQPTRHSSEST